MYANAWVGFGPLIDLQIGFFLDRRDNHIATLCARRIQQQKREASITGNQAKLGGSGCV